VSSGTTTAGGHPAGNSANGTVRDRSELDALTKGDLLRLTDGLDIEGRSSMSKPELVDAIIREGGVELNALTREELLRLGRAVGSDVQTSMTKNDLIAVISTRGGRTR
jgi:hypothetical protein